MRVGDRNFVAEAQLALKMAVAGSLGWWLATLAGEPRPVFAAFVGLVAMSSDPFGSFSSTVARILGVFAGVAIGVGLLQLDLRLLFVVVLALFAGTLVGIALRVGERANVQPAISALFLVGVGRGGALHAGVARLWETAIGAGVTLLVAVLLWPPHPVRELQRRLDRLRRALGDDLAAVADDLATGSGTVAERMTDVRAHSLEAVREVFALAQARRALRLNPLRRLDARRLDELAVRVNLAARLYRHARSVARDVLDARLQDADLAAATRALAEAADRSLRAEDPSPALAAAEARLVDVPGDEAALVVRAQLRQMLADLAPA